MSNAELHRLVHCHLDDPCVEIGDYSVACLDCITVFKATNITKVLIPTCRMLCTWQLLGLAVKGPWLAPGGLILIVSA